MLISALTLIAFGNSINIPPEIPKEIPQVVEHILERQKYIDPELDFGDVPRKNSDNSVDEQREGNAEIIKNNTQAENKEVKKEEYTQIIGEYSTTYNARNKNRTTNLCLAADAINNKVINPNEEFSLNKTVGKRTYEKGYQDAKIIVSGKYVDGLGGGVCQVSSTLFNAALNANMTITERKNHSLKSSYVPVGRDATVAWGFIDFKFKNPYDEPIKIIADCSKSGVLHIKILVRNEIIKPNVKINVTHKNNSYTLKRTANGEVNYVTVSKYK